MFVSEEISSLQDDYPKSVDHAMSTGRGLYLRYRNGIACTVRTLVLLFALLCAHWLHRQTHSTHSFICRPPQVIINEMEKCFIQSLREVDTGERSTLPALLAPACTPQHIVPLASPCAPENQDEYVGSCVGPVGPKKTLVLDLDETLISSTRTPCPCDFLVRDTPKFSMYLAGCNFEQKRVRGVGGRGVCVEVALTKAAVCTP